MIDYFFYTTFVLLGAFVSYLDFKGGKIPNRYLFLMLVIALLFFYFKCGFSWEKVKLVLFSFFISILLWAIGFWPAGDAKLFTIYSLFLAFKNEPGTLEINTFVPLFILFFPILMIKSKKEKLKEKIKKVFNSYNLYVLFSVFFGFAWAITKVFSVFNVGGSFIFYMLVAFITIEFINKFAPFTFETTYGILSILRFFIDSEVYSLSFWINFFEMIFMYLLFVSLPLELSLDLNAEEKKISKLKKGDVLLEGIVLKDENYEKETIPIGFSIFRKKFIHSTTDDGLTNEDIELIKRLKKEGKIKFDTLKVYKPIPFAPFLFLGFIITLVFGQSFPSAIKYLFYSLISYFSGHYGNSR